MPLSPNLVWCITQPYQPAFVDSRDLEVDIIERVLLPPRQRERAPLVMLDLAKAG